MERLAKQLTNYILSKNQIKEENYYLRQKRVFILVAFLIIGLFTVHIAEGC